MNLNSWFQLILYVAVLLLLAKPLGAYMAKVYQGERVFLDRVLVPWNDSCIASQALTRIPK
jgi:K+-transporting ATPase ATPase A chain